VFVATALRCSFFIVSIKTQACSLSYVSPPPPRVSSSSPNPFEKTREEGASSSTTLPRHELAQQLLLGTRKRSDGSGSLPPEFSFASCSCSRAAGERRKALGNRDETSVLQCLRRPEIGSRPHDTSRAPHREGPNPLSPIFALARAIPSAISQGSATPVFQVLSVRRRRTPSQDQAPPFPYLDSRERQNSK
jgi:hypothetical protein